jgi:hypothetical protein
MIGWHRTTLSSAFALALLALTSGALAATPPDKGEGKPGGAAPGAGEPGDKPAEGTEAPPEEKKEPPPPPPDLGGWGVGGKDDAGKFGPRGKTGKLKELEQEAKEEGPEAPRVLPPPGFAYLDTVIGFGSIRVVANRGDATSITPTASFLIGLGYRIGDIWALGARFPISTGASNGPAEPYYAGRRDPDSYKQIAIGNVELELRPTFTLTRTLSLPIGLAAVLPSAAGDFNPVPESRAQIGQAIVNEAAAQSRGWEDRALFAHKRGAVVPSIGIGFKDGGYEFEAATKVEIMIKAGWMENPEETNPVDEFSRRAGDQQALVRAVTWNWVLGASFFYGFFDGLLAPGARLWLAAGSVGDYKEIEDYSGAQLELEPAVKTNIPFTEDKAVGMEARLGYNIPLGLHLGGKDNAFVSGLRVRAGLYF